MNGETRLRYCSQCGHPNQTNAAFCGNCGRVLPIPPPPPTQRIPVWLPIVAAALFILVVASFLLWRQNNSQIAALPPATIQIPPSPTRTTPTATPLPTTTPVPTTTPAPSLTPSPTASPPPSPTHTATPTAAPARQPASGSIVFTCYMNQIDQICTIDADGRNLRQLTNLSATSFYASFAPDGQEIVFSSRHAGSFQLYSINSNGGNPRAIGPTHLGGLYAPAISPDGRQIAFTAAQNDEQHIWVMNRDGSGLRQLTTAPTDNQDPTWSPDGRQIAYYSNQSGVNAHYILDLTSGESRRLETGVGSIGGRTDWSPDGQWLAFYAGPRNSRQIYKVHVHTLEVQQLTAESSNLAPSFSPDGQWITFTSYRDGDAEVFIMRSDGSEVTQLTFNGRADWQPRWQR
ncbi:MAG: PD40 domain-containing protein [Anaerolineales bacterium]|nr:PD40 domain-containing protein [Anaerolineales bacterium]MCB8951630.1 PD40 domain-containing protein [Ardenticatenales bacterium]